METKELKAALDAAKSKLDAKPDDEALKKAYNDAKAAFDAANADGEDDQDDPSPGDKGDDEEDALDESGLDEKTKSHLKKLRRENAKHRSEKKNLADRLSKIETGLKTIFGGDDENESPEEKAKALKSQNEALGFKTAVLEAAIEHGVSKADRKYFEFLVAEKIQTLEEGEELSDDDLSEIAKSAKRTKTQTTTSVDGDGGTPNPKGKEGEVTYEKFLGMTVIEKSMLHSKNPALYNELFAKAKKERRL